MGADPLLRQMLSDAPYALYPLDETSGTTASDVSGNARHASITGSPTLGDPGPAGLKAVKIVTDASGIVAPTNLVAADTSDFTVCLFAQVLGVGLDGTNTANILWSQYYNNFNTRSNMSVASVATGPTSINVAVSGAGFSSSGTPVNTGQWHHFASRRTSGVVDLFVDGVIVATGTLAGAADSKATWFGGMSQTGTNAGLNGRLAYAAVYRSALATDRIKTYYKAGLRSGVSV